MTTAIPRAVSLWVGVSPSHEALMKYVDIHYSAKDAAWLSQFADDFKTGYYDEDSMEVWFLENATRSVPNLLHGCSYDSLLIPKFVEAFGEMLPSEINSCVLLYDFRHDGLPGQHGPWNSAVKLRYLGSVTMDVPWPVSTKW
jgi:hypothetical protein